MLDWLDWPFFSYSFATIRFGSKFVSAYFNTLLSNMEKVYVLLFQTMKQVSVRDQKRPWEMQNDVRTWLMKLQSLKYFISVSMNLNDVEHSQVMKIVRHVHWRCLWHKWCTESTLWRSVIEELAGITGISHGWMFSIFHEELPK